MENIPGRTHKETAELFTKRFRPLTHEQVTSYCKNHKIHCGNTGRFQKGHPSPTKGKKQTDYASPEGIERTKKTRFKKGIIPHNTLPVGAERNLIGYIEIKVAQPNKWMLKHRWLWEQAYGPIPEGHYIRFKDGDPMNLALDNLIMIDKETHIAMTRMQLHHPPADMFETAVLTAKLDACTRKKHRELHKVDGTL